MALNEILPIGDFISVKFLIPFDLGKRVELISLCEDIWRGNIVKVLAVFFQLLEGASYEVLGGMLWGWHMA